MSIHTGRDSAAGAKAEGPVWGAPSLTLWPVTLWVVQSSSVAPEISIVLIFFLKGKQDFQFFFWRASKLSFPLRLLKDALHASGFLTWQMERSPRSFGFISRIHLEKSPQKGFGKRRQNLEGDHTNLLYIAFKWTRFASATVAMQLIEVRVDVSCTTSPRD